MLKNYYKINSQVLESSARLKLEFDDSAAAFLERFSLLASLLCFAFLFSLLATGTHLYIFMVVSPIVTHFFSLIKNVNNYGLLNLILKPYISEKFAYYYFIYFLWFN